MNGGLDHVKLVGGNAYGIYVAAVQSNEDTLTPPASDLRIGDKIIEFNRSVCKLQLILSCANITKMARNVCLVSPPLTPHPFLFAGRCLEPVPV